MAPAIPEASPAFLPIGSRISPRQQPVAEVHMVRPLADETIRPAWKFNGLRALVAQASAREETSATGC